MKPTIKEFQERIYCETCETNGKFNWISFYDTEEEYECKFDFTLEEIEEAEGIIAKYYKDGESVVEDWLTWENKVIENHYDEIEEIEEEEE